MSARYDGRSRPHAPRRRATPAPAVRPDARPRSPETAMTLATDQLERLAIDTIRTLAIDGVQQANSGHPGRDRFVLSAGHASMLLYSLLYLTGYGVELDDLKQFRQWGSITPG